MGYGYGIMDGGPEMRILQINTCEYRGGAANVAWNLHRKYQAAGQSTWFMVRQKKSSDRLVLEINESAYQGAWTKAWFAMSNFLLPVLGGKVRGAGRVYTALHNIGEFWRWWAKKLGHEDFYFPSTRHILGMVTERPDIVHCHNLHGNYFNLRILPWLSRQVPVVLTLHDAWLLSGHCGYSFNCQRWETGCGYCPDLSLYPSIVRDATAYNWRVKKDIFAKSRFYVVTPSRWLMQMVERSILAPAIIKSRVIPNGVDLQVFHPGNILQAREKLGIPQDARILLSVGDAPIRNTRKNYPALETAARLAAESLTEQRLIFICLGDSCPQKKIGRLEIRFVDYQEDPAIVAQYYQAADVYLHAAVTDTFPNTILEALACGVPVIALSTGGISEQVEDSGCGLLVAPFDEKMLTGQIIRVLKDKELAKNLSKNASEHVRSRFDVNNQAVEYLSFFRQILEDREKKLQYA